MTTSDFAAFGLASPLTDALARAGFDTPTPIQAQAIAPQMAGRDILGIAQTGTGKTAAFALPILHQLLALQGRPAPKTCRALVLAPTRELAVQIEAAFRTFAGGARLTTLLVLGGMSRSAQVRAMARGVDVVVATPGRLTDLMADRSILLDQTRWVVLDEADRMLDMGFIQPVRKIVAALHPRRQSALFSATMPSEVAGLAQGFLKDPVRVEVAPQATTVDRVEQRLEVVETAAKRKRLAELLSAPEAKRVIVFARTKHGADRVTQNLEKDGIDAEAIHGNKAQNARQRALNAFRNGHVRVLVATDIVARGIDVPGVSHIINYDLPDEPENYVHRIGRTAPQRRRRHRHHPLRPGRDEEAPRGREGNPHDAPPRRPGSRPPARPGHGEAEAEAGRAWRPGPRGARPQPPPAPHPARRLRPLNPRRERLSRS